MNCQEALALLYDIIDREASEVDTSKVQEHIKKCGTCADIYRIEGVLDQFLKDRLEHKSAEHSHEKLKSRITLLLDQEDGHAPFADSGSASGPVQPLRLPRTAHYLAAAAALVLVIWGGIALSGFVSHYQTYYQFEKAHLAASRDNASFASAEDTRSALASSSSTFGFAPSSRCGDAILVGGKFTQMNDTPVGHFLFSKDDITISLYIVPAAQVAIPDELNEFRVVNADGTFYDHHCRGCRLVYQQYGDLVFITATEDHAFDLLHFVPAVEPI
jgi:hypothetical protein